MKTLTVQRIDASLAQAFVPPASDYQFVSPDWEEAEYRCFETGGGSFGGYWTGEPGAVAFDAWPYGEVGVLTKGRVAVEGADGTRWEFSAGEAFFIPAGFAGSWITLESSEKVFVAIRD